MLVGCVDAVLEAPGLFVVGEVQEEFEDDDVVVDEETLELVDVVEAVLHDFVGDELVDAGGEDVLVVRAVEDADHAARQGRRCGRARGSHGGLRGVWGL